MVITTNWRTYTETDAALHRKAEALVARTEERCWVAELHRLRAVFLTALGADETLIEALFYEAIGIAKQQKSISLEKRAQATYLLPRTVAHIAAEQ
ncbi:MAG: hypothetical protein JO232_10925 [Verrucomicrobia bacterium]|nr:hypothetical protein [Verrucomicrobiota bacterium]